MLLNLTFCSNPEKHFFHVGLYTLELYCILAMIVIVQLLNLSFCGNNSEVKIHGRPQDTCPGYINRFFFFERVH